MRASLFWPAGVMILSSEDGNVSWKLNDLIHASRRASYRRYESLEHSDKGQEFLPWTPTMLKLIDDQIVEAGTDEQQVDSAIDLPDEKESLEPTVEEKLVPEEEMISKIQESYQRGFDEGKAATESDLADKFLKLNKLIEGFTSFKENLDGFHSPLVKLSLALANHLVRAELRLDGTAIEELVRQSLSAIESSTENSVVVYLAEEDFEHADNILGETYPNVKFEIDHDLSSGSLRVVMDDTSIEDLIENRLDALSDQLFRSQNQLNPGRQQLLGSDINNDGETLISPDEEVSDPSDTTISKPITSADDEHDLKNENLIDEMSSPPLPEESSAEITANEDGSGKAPEEVEFDSENNDDH